MSYHYILNRTPGAKQYPKFPPINAKTMEGLEGALVITFVPLPPPLPPRFKLRLAQLLLSEEGEETTTDS